MRSCQGLTALEAEIARDLELTAHPHMEWMVPRLRGAAPALDVLIVGAGQSGLVTAFGLMRERVGNILVIDRAPEGKEGPWVTFARMPTLRSPKLQTGPDLGIPSLTFQAWYEAQHGAQAFADMNLIPSVDWHEYLMWYRRILGLPVRNDVAATAIAPGRLDDGGPCLLVTLSTGEVLATRKLVLATGQDGTGEWWMPDFVRNLPADRRAHTCELDIDFEPAQGQGGGRAGRRRLGDGQCRGGAGARRRGPSLLRAAGRPACSASAGSPSRASCATWATCPTSGAGASWPTS